MTPLTDLRRSLFCLRSDLMSMFSLYCDDSGTDEGNPVAAVAGYIGKVSRWEQFTKEWQKALKDFGIKQMRRAQLENFKGEFKNWNGARRDKFLQRIQPIIRDHITIPIGSSVIKDDFHRIIPEDIQRKFGGVFGWCIQDCLIGASSWYKVNGYRNAIQWIFEAGTRGHGQVDAMFNELYSDPATRDKFCIKGWAFQDKSIVPLQAADLLAYEVYKYATNQILDKGGKYPIRFSMTQLVRTTDERYLQHWSEARLLDWLNEWNIRHQWLSRE